MDVTLFFVWTISGITPIVRWSFRLDVNDTSLTSDLEVIQKFLLDNLNQVSTSPLVVRCSPELFRRTLEETTSPGDPEGSTISCVANDHTGANPATALHLLVRSPYETPISFSEALAVFKVSPRTRLQGPLNGCQLGLLK